jgi:cytochrome c551/c552
MYCVPSATPAIAVQALAGKQDSSPSASSQQALIDKYCVTCHNQRLKTGGLTLDNVDVASVGDTQFTVPALHGVATWGSNAAVEMLVAESLTFEAHLN